MTDRDYRHLSVALSVAIVLVLAVLVYQWTQCDGAFVRTLFWFRCIP